MDRLLPQLRSFPPDAHPSKHIPDAQYEAQIKPLVQTLSKTPANVLTQNTKDGRNLLDELNPSIHTLPYLYVLLAHAQSSQDTKGKAPISAVTTPVYVDINGDLWPKMVGFLERFDSRQVQYAGPEWRRLIEVVARSARLSKKPLLAVRPLRHAILRLDPTSSTLTSTHVLFVRLCLEARTYRVALPVIDRDILDFPLTSQAMMLFTPMTKQPGTPPITASSGLSAKLTYADHLQYHLFGAMIYIGLKKWERALEFLDFVISTPTANATSAIMVDAYKKWILVNILLYGRHPRMPRTVAGPVEQVYRAIALPYERIAEVFQSGNGDLLQEEFEAGRSLWRADRNTGLLLLVLEAFQRFAVRNLEKIYSTISVEEITRRWGVDRPSYVSSVANPFDMEQEILGMIAAGDLDALLTHPTSSSSTILNFSITHSRTTEAEQLAQVDAQIERLEQLKAHSQHVDRKVSLSKDHISWLHRMKLDPAAAVAVRHEREEAQSMLWDMNGMPDEDVMSD